eukprot:TRINITY_DN2045_c0_g1_i1.p1 TRINITY_DN2045_c0_g1~~TRINITY_DN2045_c0_g1_i1.p1  ORF type:complete len:274 (+),score=69.62 TRINITY_DN2045_c0_g1_i1:84-824(+)
MALQNKSEQNQLQTLKEENKLLRNLNSVYCEDVQRLEAEVQELKEQLGAAMQFMGSLKESEKKDFNEQFGAAVTFIESLKDEQVEGDEMEESDTRSVRTADDTLWGCNLSVDWSTYGMPKQFRQGRAMEVEDPDADWELLDWSSAALPKALRPQVRVAGPRGARRVQRKGAVLHDVALKSTTLRAAVSAAKIQAELEKPSVSEAVKRATPFVHLAKGPDMSKKLFKQQRSRSQHQPRARSVSCVRR